GEVACSGSLAAALIRISPTLGAMSEDPPKQVTRTPRAGGWGSDIAFPEVKMHIYRPNEPVSVRIHKSEICTARKPAGIVRHVEFAIAGTSLVGTCVPGQWVGIIPPGADAKGRPHQVRLYSLASPTRGEIDGAGAGTREAEGTCGTAAPARNANIISTTVK